ncbi:MAG: hypothetical protein JNL96_17345 [Planctomycetaceae bacterium]|nr:hypothetical protein [Planctomycetaceae bacterium]
MERGKRRHIAARDLGKIPPPKKPWHVVIESRTLSVIYCGQNAAEARGAFGTSESTVWVESPELGDAQRRAALSAARIREMDKRK